MRILVLDTIHGGKVIADHLTSLGHFVDMVDVYRHIDGITEEEAISREYDLVTAPVHLDPDYTLFRKISTPFIFHHDLVRWIIPQIPGHIIEITGKRGKSTTATALAFLMDGPGILHTSSGLFRYPDKKLIGRYSITPASLLIAHELIPEKGWMIAELSLGFCGVGTLGILTSGDDYPVAGGKRSALTLKTESSHRIPQILVPPGMNLLHDGCVHSEDLIQVEEKTAYYTIEGRICSYTNPLLLLPGYKTPLILASAAALLLGIDPSPLSSFEPLPGRMEIRRESGYVIIDNSNTGTCYETSCDAAAYGTEITGEEQITLIIGQEAASVCENFQTEEIISAIITIKPYIVILIPGDNRIKCDTIRMICNEHTIGFYLAGSSDEALKIAKNLDNPLILLSVKRWK